MALTNRRSGHRDAYLVSWSTVHWLLYNRHSISTSANFTECHTMFSASTDGCSAKFDRPEHKRNSRKCDPGHFYEVQSGAEHRLTIKMAWRHVVETSWMPDAVYHHPEVGGAPKARELQFGRCTQAVSEPLQ